MYGDQCLVYCGLLLPIHGPQFEPVFRKPQVLRGATVDEARQWHKQEAPPGKRAGLSRVSDRFSDRYLAGVFASLLFAVLLFGFLV